MDLFGFECRKIFLQKGFAVIVFLSAVLNLFLLNYSTNDSGLSYKPQEYRRMMEDMRTLSMEEATRYLTEYNERLREDDVYLLSEQDIRNLCLYTGDLWNERDLLQAGLEELENAAGYDTYLKEIQDDASRMLEVSIFRKNSGYSTRNLVKTAKDYQKMEDMTLRFDISQGIIQAAGFPATDLLGLLLLFTSCVFLILNEKQNGQLAFVMCTARGRREMGMTKIGVLIPASSLAAGVLYAENFIYMGIVYGFGDLSRPVQSVPAYHSCILKISVMEYFLLFFLVKVLVYFVISLLAFWICIHFRQLLKIFGSFLGMAGLELAAWKIIPVNSIFSFLKYLNLYYFLQTDRLLAVYQNVNLFSWPVGSMIAAGVCLTVLTAACIGGVLYEMNGNRILMERRQVQKPSGKPVRFVWFTGNRSLTGFEYLKLVKKSGGLLLLFLFLLLQICRVQNYTWLRLPEQVYYRTYMNYLAGPLDGEIAAYVEKENERYRYLGEKMAEFQTQSGSSIEEMEVKEKMAPYTAWEKVDQEYKQLLSRQKESGQTLFLVYGDGYRLLTGEGQGADMTDMEAFLVSLLLVLLTAGTFSCDSGPGMNRVIGAASLGRRDTLHAKKKVVYFLGLISFLLVYGADFLKVYMEVGINQFTAPVQSLFFLSGCKISINLAQYLLLLYLIRLLGVYVILHGILIISLISESTIRSMLISSFLFLLPPILGLLEIASAEKVTFLSLLTGGEILKVCLSGNIDLSTVVIFVMTVLVIISSEIFMRYVFDK